MTDDDKLEIGFEEFIALHKKLFDAARQAREDQMQQASRQLQYKERAKREVEAAVLQSQWDAEEGTEIQKVIEQHKLNFTQDLAQKHIFSVAVPYKIAFMQSETEKALVPYNQQYDAWLKSQVDSISKSVLEVAKEIRDAERKKQKEKKGLEIAKILERDADAKQGEAKRKMYEESHLKAKEVPDEWRVVKAPSGSGKRFTNSNKPEETKTPAAPAQAKEEAKRPEPPSPITPSLSSIWSKSENPTAKPTEEKVLEPKSAPSAGYKSKFTNKKKEGGKK